MPQAILPIREAGAERRGAGASRPGVVSAAAAGAEAGAAALSDAQVIARVLAGDVAWFELIMRRYNQRLFRVARSVLGNDSDAEDAVQEAYLQAFRHLPQFEGRAALSTWLTRIALHAALGTRRKRKPMSSLEPDAADSTAEPIASPSRRADEVAGNRELGNVLGEAIERLPIDLRTVFVLRAVEDLDTLETARCLELTEANVKVRLHRARAQLRQDIDERIGVEARRLYQFDGGRCDRLVAAVLRRIGRQADRLDDG